MTEDGAMKTVAFDEIGSARRLLSRGESFLVVDEKKHPIGLLRPVGWPDESIPLPERRRQFLRRSAALGGAARRVFVKVPWLHVVTTDSPGTSARR